MCFSGTSCILRGITLEWTADVWHLNIDRLELCVEVESSHAVLSTDARLFVAAERQLTRVDIIIVDVDAASLQRCYHSVCTLYVPTTSTTISIIITFDS